MKVLYKEHRFDASSLEVIGAANRTIEKYQEMGFTLTLRQLYYQFVAAGLLANSDKNYKRLGSIVNDARLAGMIDWEAIEDRTRFVRELAHWNHPSELLGACARQYRTDMWTNQTMRPEVWIEKDALVGVFEGVCQEYDVPLFSCRGYTSQSEVWKAAQRFKTYIDNNQTPVIIHFGDHDPSGIDMTRDIRERIRMFLEDDADMFDGVVRKALLMSQVDELKPPPNPAKLTDSRCRDYIRKFGPESWELDALNPEILAGLVRKTLDGLIEQPAWDETKAAIQEQRDRIQRVANRWKD